MTIIIWREYLLDHIRDLGAELLEHGNLDKFRDDVEELLDEAAEGLQ